MMIYLSYATEQSKGKLLTVNPVDMDKGIRGRRGLEEIGHVLYGLVDYILVALVVGNGQT